MGSGRDKRKKAKPKAPGQGAEKTSRKTEKNEGKAVKRAAKAAKVRMLLNAQQTIPFVLFFTILFLNFDLNGDPKLAEVLTSSLLLLLTGG